MKFAGQLKPHRFMGGYFKGVESDIGMFKYSAERMGGRVPTTDKSLGRGDLGVPGQSANGNTANPVGNGQRDTPMTDYRSSDMPGDKRSTHNRLESRKRNKLS